VQGYAQVALAAVLWGTLGLAARRLFAAGLTPLDTATWRATGAFVALLIFGLLTNRGALFVARRDLTLLAAYGAVSVAGFMTVYFTAIALTTVATAAVLLYTAPAWVVVLARLFFGEPLTTMKTSAVGLTFAGSVLVIGAIGPAAVRLTPAGVLAGLGAGLTYALYSIFGKTALRRLSPLTTVLYTLGFGAALLIAAARGLPRLPHASLAPLAYLVIVPTAIAYVLYIRGLKRVEAGRASVVATLEPVVAAFTGALILREPFGAAQWAGTALVLAGVVLVQGEHILRRPGRRHPPGAGVKTAGRR
jgi:DME family drug/metabolite transporter